MIDNLFASAPTITICAIALVGVWYAVKNEVRRENKNLQQQTELATLRAQNAGLREDVARLEREVQRLTTENNVLRQAPGSGVNISGSAQVHVGGGITGRDSARAGGDMTQGKKAVETD